MDKNNKLLPIFLTLLFICLLALVLRFYRLSQIPNGISADEAAFGYNAYSILKTGRDEFGIKFPLLFQSFNDQKNPVLVYILVPFVWLFGLNELAIRLPSAILGVAVIPLFYLLTKSLTKDEKLSLLSAFLAAISPWLIQYSRINLETMAALFFCLLGVWLFLEADRKKILYILSSICFGLAFWTYYASKFWVIFLGGFLVLREIFSQRKIDKFLASGIIIFTIISLPYLKLLSSGQILARQYGISVFADPNQLIQDSKLIANDLLEGEQFGKVVHNRRLTPFNQATTGFLNILNPSWLFGQVGQGGSSQIPGTRLLFIWQLPLIFFGILGLSKFKRLSWLMFFWLLVGFIPGALTNLPVFDRRILVNSYPLIFLTALGLEKIFLDLKDQHLLQKSALFIFVIAVLSSFSFYLHFYFYHGPKAIVDLWGNGMKELVFQTAKIKKDYDKVIVSSKFDQPLTYFLFYEQYRPEKYLRDGGTVSGDLREERNHFANYQFKSIKEEEITPTNLYVWRYDESSRDLSIKKIIYRADGRPFAYIGAAN